MIIVFALEIYFVTSIREQWQETNLRYTQMMCDNAVNYIKEMMEDFNRNLSGIYEKETVTEDMVWYLESPLDEYLRKKLDVYSESNRNVYEGISEFAASEMEQNPSIVEISFISYAQERKTDYRIGGTQSYFYNKTDLERLNNSDMVHDNTFYIKKELRNPITLDSIGLFMITYDGTKLKEAFQFYQNAQLIAFDGEGSVLYSSEGIGSEQFFDENKIILGNVKIEQKLGAFVDLRKIGGLTIAGYIRKEEARAIPIGIWVTLISVGMVLFAIGELFVYLKLKHLEKRMDGILQAMDKVTQGDLKVRIQRGREEDELDIIGENFNQMCTDLSTYIQKSYMAEIEQKNAEISALQSQINPHFLYNTLESIRMKAISNGDKEVGKMLYCLAVIFRSQVKEDNIITLAKELHYCKKYLELFEFRYQGKFSFEIECREEWMDASVIKFIIQPFIENYFVHGIRLEDSNNVFKISVGEDNRGFLIFIEDNGRGMGIGDIEEKNRQLRENSQQGNSIGMINVQRRMRAVYGEDYGVQIQEREIGLKVVLSFPKEETKCIK